MGRFSDVLLTVDFDRTLTAPDSTIPQRNLDAIEYFMAEGGAFTVNTGRSIPMYSSVMDAVPVNAPLLLYNGSAAYDKATGELSLLKPIDLDWIGVMRRCHQLFPDLTVELQGTRHHYLMRKNENWEIFCTHNGCPWAYATESDDLGVFLKFTIYGAFREPTVSHLFTGTPQELERIQQARKIIEEEFSGKVEVFESAPRILDVHARGVGKGNIARTLQASLGRRHLVCVGDALNDLDMLRQADFAFVPADAALADRFENVCECAQGAVADVIYKKIPEIID